jgi:hypothetical protein
MGQEEYFGVEPELNCVDPRVGEGQASCCGVNLAFALLGLVVVFWFSFPACAAVPLLKS